MPRGRKTALTIRLTLAERYALLRWQRSPTLSAGLVRRGRIILLVSEGKSISEIVRMVGISRRFVYKWVQRFLAEGLEGLVDKPGRGSRSGQRRSPWRCRPTPSPAAMANERSERGRREQIQGRPHRGKLCVVACEHNHVAQFIAVCSS